MEEAENTHASSAKNSFGRLCWALLASRIVANIIYAIVEGVIIAIATYDISVETDPFPTPDILTYPWVTSILTLVTQMIGIFVAFRTMRAVPTAKYEEIDLNPKDICIFFFACFPIAYVGDIIGTFLASLLSGGTSVNPIEVMMDNNPIMIFYAVSLGPVLEEFIFRKQIIDRCVKYGEKTAILFSALCFALFHTNLYQFFYTFGTGLIFGYVYIRTRQLRYTVIMHMLLNAVSAILSVVQSETLSIVAMAVLSVVGLALLITKVRHLTFLPTEEQLQGSEIFRTVYLNGSVLLFFITTILLSILRIFL